MQGTAAAQDKAAFRSEAEALSTWLRDAAWPLWLAHGIDHARGGFFEALDLHTHRCAAPFRRLRVVARQIFVFSHAHLHGLAGADAAVRLGLAFLDRHAAHEDGGYAWRFDLAHRPIDLRRDLYDHAFVLLAFASAAPVVGAANLRGKALDLLAWLDRAFAHPAGGYLESLPPALPRRQNPHMHLLEALLAAHAAFGDDVFLDRAGTLVALFADRLFDQASGTLPEYFDDELRPLREGGTYAVEPGHHCEWVWLLLEAVRLGVRHPMLDELPLRLMAFVDRHAILAESGAVMDEVGSDGAPRASGARLWPQTERLRAELVRPDGSPARRLQAVRALRAYVRPDGLWHERRLASGEWSLEAAPASSLYHLTGAIKKAVLF